MFLKVTQFYTVLSGAEPHIWSQKKERERAEKTAERQRERQGGEKRETRFERHLRLSNQTRALILLSNKSYHTVLWHFYSNVSLSSLHMRLKYLPNTYLQILPDQRLLCQIYHRNTIYVLFWVPVTSFNSLCNILWLLHSAIFILLSPYESKHTSDPLHLRHCAVFVSNIGKVSVSKTSANEARIASNSLQGKRVRLGE